MTMNPTIKAQWVAALRSGDYEQGTGQLKGVAGYCCLGVLCDLHRKAMKKGAGWDYTSYRNANGGVPPKCVVDWAGLPAQNPDVKHGSDDEANLASLNDYGLSFAEIADVISEQL